MLLAHSLIFDKASSTSVPISKAVESSANKLVYPLWFPEFWGKSLTFAEKEIGPKMDPCGTP